MLRTILATRQWEYLSCLTTIPQTLVMFFKDLKWFEITSLFECIQTLERRWSNHTFRYGYLVTT
jgi:hypothetical protein